MQQTEQQSVSRILSWDKIEIYPMNCSCPSEVYTALSTKTWNTKMSDKREKKNRRLKISPTHLQLFKEGIKFMEPIVTVGEKRMHHFTPKTKQT